MSISVGLKLTALSCLLRDEELSESSRPHCSVTLSKVSNPFESFPFKDMLRSARSPATYTIGSFFKVKVPAPLILRPKRDFANIFMPMELSDTDLVMVPSSKKKLAANEIYASDAYMWEAVLQQIREEKTCLQIEGDESFKEMVLSNLKILITRPVGRKLLQAILSLDKPLYFNKHPRNKAKIRMENGELVARVLLTGPVHPMYSICDVDGVPSLVELPYALAIAHELIHVLQNSTFTAEDIVEFSKSKRFHFAVEKFTIAGIDGYDHIPSENAFRQQFGLPMRLTHRVSKFPPFNPLIHDPRATIGRHRWLNHSVYLGLTTEVEKLLETGLSPSEAADIPVIHNSGEMLDLLLKAARVPIASGVKESLLHTAASRGAEACIDPLMEASTPVDVKDSSGRTPLHRAVMNSDHVTAENLLTYGADVEALAPLYKTPLALAIEQRDLKMVKLLLRYGARVSRSAENALELLQTRTSRGLVAEQKFLWSFCYNVRKEFAKARCRPMAPIRFA